MFFLSLEDDSIFLDPRYDLFFFAELELPLFS